MVLVLVARERVADLLAGRLLTLRLERGRGGVGVTLELVADVLSGRLLRVGLQRHVAINLTDRRYQRWKGKQTLRAAEALSVIDWRPASDMMIMRL